MRRIFAIVVSACALAACSSATPADSGSNDASPAATSSPVTEPSAAAGNTPPSTPPPTVAASTAPPTTAPPTTAPVPTRPTIDDLLASGRVLNIAHAGGDQEWPHSTFYAYDRAVEAGADVLEMDVQLTADGVLIVQHDDTVDGTTDGTGRVDGFTFEQIRELDAAHWYSPGCWPCRELDPSAYPLRGVRTGDQPAPDGVDPETLRIVSFAEVVARYPDRAFDVEIKGTGDAAAATAAQLAAEIDEFGLTESIVVVSFDDPTVELFRGLAPEVAVSPGVGAMTAWLLGGETLDPAFRIVQVPPRFGDVDVITPAFWEAVGVAGVAVWMWPNDASTQENAAFYQEMIDQGVTGIIAGRPSEVPA